MSSFGVEPDRARLLRLAEAQGCDVHKGAHSIVIKAPSGALVGNTPSSKTGARALPGLKTKMRRAGLVVDPDEWDRIQRQERMARHPAGGRGNTMAGTRTEVAPDDQAPPTPVAERFICGDCSKSFETFTGLRGHRSIHFRKNETPTQDALLAAVTAENGLHPREYAERLGITSGAVSSAARTLIKAGKIRVKGQRSAARYFLPGPHAPVGEVPPPPSRKAKPVMSKNGKPGAGPVKLRRQEPGDPAERVKMHAELLSHDVKALIEENAALKAELAELKSFKDKVIERLGNVLEVI